MTRVGIEDEAEGIRPGVVSSDFAIHVLGVIAVCRDGFRAGHEARANRRFHGISLLQRIHPLPALGNPFDGLVLTTLGNPAPGIACQRECAFENGLGHPGLPDRTAQLMDDHAMLQGFDTAAKLQ